MLPAIEDVYEIAEMIIKVKEPIEPEYKLIKKGQLLFTYFHFASDRELTDAMMAARPVCVAYETVRLANGQLPLLIPMSEVAGRMSIQEACRFLEKPQGGRGVLMGGVPGVKPAKVLILGAGVLRHVADVMPKNVKTLYSSRHNIEQELPTADVVVGSVLVPGAKTPHLVTRDMLALMQPGALLVDVAIDQGGCFETSHPTTHSEPTYVLDGITHYAVANIPGAVARTSTLALTNATLPYAIKLANLGWKEACRRDPALAQGVNMVDGHITYPGVAEAFDLPLEKLDLN